MLTLARLLCFNSIKVQLEQGVCREPLCIDVRFNSIKVQLELVVEALEHVREAEFQFHKGAIRTRDPRSQ